STFTLVGIAIDRYVLVMFPMKVRASSSQCIGVIGAIWIASIIFTLPPYFHMRYFDAWAVQHPCRVFCLESGWDPPVGRAIYAVVVLMLKTVVPFGIIGFCYWQIARKLKLSARRFSTIKMAKRSTTGKQ